MEPKALSCGVTIGNAGFLVTNLTNGATRRVKSVRSNPMGVASLGDNKVLTVGDSVSLGITDLGTGSDAEIIATGAAAVSQ
jgi:hypothetical protein